MRFIPVVGAAALALVLGLPAAAQGPTAIAGAAASSLGRDDREFIRNAVESGLAEVQASQLAVQRAQADDVKRFAQRMVDDHLAANAQLAALAQRKGAEVPGAPALVEQGRIKLLQAAQGAEFDQHYVDDLAVKTHQGTVALFEQQAERGQDADLKRFAQRALPQLKMHLQVAQQLQAQIAAQGGGGTSMGSGSAPQR